QRVHLGVPSRSRRGPPPALLIPRASAGPRPARMSGRIAGGPMRTLIANGTVVTAEGSYPADVLVDGERIAQIGTGLGAGATDDSLEEMDQLVAEGIPDFKLFTAYPGVFFSDDGAIFRAMQRTAKNGGLIMMHAENGLAIDVIAADTVAAGTTDPIGHGLARY